MLGGLSGVFLSDSSADDPAIDALAAALRERQWNVGWAVETVLRSRRFFANAELGNRVAAPPEYAVGAVRALECFTPPPSTLLLADWMARMGQELYYPPNVGGWAEGALGWPPAPSWPEPTSPRCSSRGD